MFSNICEVQTITCEGFQYFITFIDDYSQFITIHPIKKKSDALETFKDFLVESECQTGHKLKVLHTDGGGKYFSNEFTEYLKGHGIIHEKTNPDTPQENGVAECVNRTMVSMTIAMLENIKSSIGHTAWPYALHHAALIKNVVPHSTLPPDMSPFELWAFLVFDPNTHRIHESCNVHFFEGSPNSECVTIEIPDVESQSHVVRSDGKPDADNDVEGNLEGNVEGGGVHVDEGGDDEVLSGQMPIEPHQSGHKH